MTSHQLSVVQVLAHRGASAAYPENTIEAFAGAAAMGAHAVELDVRRTRDGVLVVHHNPHLRDGRLVCAIDAADLPASVASLDAALDACAGMWVNVEIKNDPAEPDFDASESIADQTCALLDARGEHGRWLISSFRLETIDRYRHLSDQAGTKVRTAWLTEGVPEGVTELLTTRGHSALHPWVGQLQRADVERCHEAGIEVNTWTCDDPRRMRELIEWGIDGICTNVPDVALAVLAESS